MMAGSAVWLKVIVGGGEGGGGVLLLSSCRSRPTGGLVSDCLQVDDDVAVDVAKEHEHSMQSTSCKVLR